MENTAPFFPLVALVLVLLVAFVLFVKRSSKRELAHEAELKALREKVNETPKVEPPIPPTRVPSEKRVLWRIGDRTEVDLGNGVYTLAKILDFDDTDDGGVDASLLFEGGVRLHGNSSESTGFWYVPVDDLRKPREGSPDAIEEWTKEMSYKEISSESKAVSPEGTETSEKG